MTALRFWPRRLPMVCVTLLLVVGLQSGRPGDDFFRADGAPLSAAVSPGPVFVVQPPAPEDGTRDIPRVSRAVQARVAAPETADSEKPAYLVRLEEWNRQPTLKDDFRDSDLQGEMGYWFAEMGAADLKGSVNLEVAGRQTNPHLRFDFEVGGGGWQFAHAKLAFWRHASLEGGLLRFRIRADRPMSIAVCLIEARSSRDSGWERRLEVDTEWREISLPLDEHHFRWSKDGLPPRELAHSLAALQGFKWRCSEAQRKGTLYLDDIALQQRRATPAQEPVK
ncbi:hypothetical protein [Acanthopleuribacter pedis]|uniref:Uncharacterized protein n=1 Tax=Acanthopleuribacter pedis TaxID=442870 RepID=A0A8J7Q403_9BACT|nr:hypothetical protein [Acanthopleuribacter pedis]MBO1317652.1 hypothetical protein [Acanthopleuribacter pedis]